jgi:hypothetical protein
MKKKKEARENKPKILLEVGLVIEKKVAKRSSTPTQENGWKGSIWKGTRQNSRKHQECIARRQSKAQQRSDKEHQMGSKWYMRWSCQRAPRVHNKR